MQSHDGQSAPDHIPVREDTEYIDGRYGWLTRSEREGFISEADLPEPYRDGVWGEEDGVFRVVLPNGHYEVTCYFSSEDSEAAGDKSHCQRGEENREIENFRPKVKLWKGAITSRSAMND